MGAYLIDHPPKVQQWYVKRNKPLTGCTVLHTAESVMDTVGPDTGAESVASFIQNRTTAGSYHDLVDSDSWLRLIPLEHGAFHDGTGSNNWALSISFACSTSDWRRMTPAKRAAFLSNGARAFADQQAWRRAHGYPLTELRLISKAQSDRGESGFIYHGLRDPGRRTDPGVAAPNVFPIDDFITACRAAMSGQLDNFLEDDMQLTDPIESRINSDIDPRTGRGKTVTVKDVLQNIQWNADETRKLAERSVAQNSEMAAAVINGLLDAPIDRTELGRGPTNLRSVLTWSDNHVDALASGIAAAASAGDADPATVRQLVADAVNTLDVKLVADTHPTTA